MKIYTKTGDKGESSLFGGKRVPKDDRRLEAYGTVDELNSIVGMCRSMNTIKAIDEVLESVQRELFMLGADLATPAEVSSTHVQRMGMEQVQGIEQKIDAIERQLEPLKNFILPGGNRTAALIHFARAVCRRAERRVVQLARMERIGEAPVIYLNRLSDLLFVAARWANALSSTSEIKWNP